MTPGQKRTVRIRAIEAEITAEEDDVRALEQRRTALVLGGAPPGGAALAALGQQITDENLRIEGKRKLLSRAKRIGYLGSEIYELEKEQAALDKIHRERARAAARGDHARVRALSEKAHEEEMRIEGKKRALQAADLAQPLPGSRRAGHPTVHFSIRSAAGVELVSATFRLDAEHLGIETGALEAEEVPPEEEESPDPAPESDEAKTSGSMEPGDRS